MTNTPTDTGAFEAEQAEIIRAGKLHWFHWLVIIGSLAITLTAWYLARENVANKTETRFQRDIEQATALITERMTKYEEALWSGVAMIAANGGDVDFDTWKRFADSLRIDSKFPGINGIGVIHYVERSELDIYYRDQRRKRSEFVAHPGHDKPHLLPITYIIPVASNAKAVGLDMAHEQNRYTAALKARDSGEAQITGPIVLVQDNSRTPGFLFYAPFYRPGTHLEDSASRRGNFAGMVYAPFVVSKLMEGTLDRESREVDIKISDGSEVLYDEWDSDSDRVSRYQAQLELPMYGRVWTLNIRGTAAFEQAYASDQPGAILAGGLLIDLMLLTLFILLTRANRRAIGFAVQMSASERQKANQLKDTVRKLEASNSELENFAYIASHDLQEPLLTIRNYSDYLFKQLSGQLDERSEKSLVFLQQAATRMSTLIEGVLAFSRIGRDVELEPIDTAKVVDNVRARMASDLASHDVTLHVTPLPTVWGSRREVRLLFSNLIDNAVKFRRKDVGADIRISCERRGDFWEFCVADNGIGVPEQYASRVFNLFTRLHNQSAYDGSGIGLAQCRKIVEVGGGRMWLKSEPTTGTRIFFTLPAR